MDSEAKRELARFLAEDVGRGDATSALLSDRRISARIISREEATVSGTAYAAELFRMSGCRAAATAGDGSRVRPGQELVGVSGPAAGVLACERTALNLLARMCGIATQTAALAARMPRGVALYSTRKTAPGLRRFDKEAVEAGGGGRHRMGLYDAVMIKDNHIAAEGSLEALVRRAAARHRRFEVEVETVAGALEAARGGATTIMLDNLAPAAVRRAVRALEREGLRGRVSLEASGGITARNIAAYAGTGVDVVSVGSITSSVRGTDLSLEVQER